MPAGESRCVRAAFRDDMRSPEHALDWCVHDLQSLAGWAVQDAEGQGVDFAAQLDWPARVLDARGYPLMSLADALGTLAGALRAVHAAAADSVAAGAARVGP